MKKLLSVILVLCIGLAVLCSCGDKEDEETSSSESTEAVGTGEFANDNEANYHDSWK